MKVFTLTSKVWLPRPLDEVFPFFADARNLEELTPPWLRFEVLTPGPVSMAVGTRIAYRLRVHGIPIRWQSEITAWQPPHRFVDEQAHGPYRLWIHEHRFSERNGNTLAEDFVRYAVYGGAAVNRLLVARDVERIFEYRRQQMQQIFGTVVEDPAAPDVVVTPSQRELRTADLGIR
jgi:ligand-binding SRPBCC domain-containing protein